MRKRSPRKFDPFGNESRPLLVSTLPLVHFRVPRTDDILLSSKSDQSRLSLHLTTPKCTRRTTLKCQQDTSHCSQPVTAPTAMPYIFDQADPSLSPAQVRKLCRDDQFRSGGTPGYCHGFAQANVLILPSKYADDFRTFCQRNPVSCPLLGETAVGDPTVPSHLAKGSDITTDCGQYCVYKDGKLSETKNNVIDEWSSESVGFVIGCSYSFEGALVENGFGLRHVEERLVLPVYQTSVQLMSAGGESPDCESPGSQGREGSV